LDEKTAENGVGEAIFTIPELWYELYLGRVKRCCVEDGNRFFHGELYSFGTENKMML